MRKRRHRNTLNGVQKIINTTSILSTIFVMQAQHHIKKDCKKFPPMKEFWIKELKEFISEIEKIEPASVKPSQKVSDNPK